MANFTQAFNITMHNEGGYANNPDDNGGETYAGVARNFWPAWPGWRMVDDIVAQHPANLNAALRANADLQTEVECFYEQNFWDAVSLGALNSQQLANQLFDTAVNMGIGTASCFLQEAINVLNPNTVIVDRQVGPRTLAAANAADTEALYNAVIALRRQRYLAIIRLNPSQAQFEDSWMSRLTPFNPQLT